MSKRSRETFEKENPFEDGWYWDHPENFAKEGEPSCFGLTNKACLQGRAYYEDDWISNRYTRHICAVAALWKNELFQLINDDDFDYISQKFYCSNP